MYVSQMARVCREMSGGQVGVTVSIATLLV
jgi:hypothetical protein